jgi:hypothetical protein
VNGAWLTATANATYYPFTDQLVRVSVCGLCYKFAYLLDTHTSAFLDMSFDSYWLSRLSGEEYTCIDPSMHSNGAGVIRLGYFNMQPGYAWASTYSSSSISFSLYHSCCSIVCVNTILDLLGDLQGDNIARETQVRHLWRQGTMEHMRPGGFVLPPPLAESTRLRTSQVSMPKSISYTENLQSPPAENYGPNDVSLHVSPRRISLDEGVPTPVNTPPSFSTFLQDGKKRYLCECGTDTAREADMKRHQRYARCHSQPQFVCDHCGKTLTRKDSCDAHKKTCPGIPRNE